MSNKVLVIGSFIQDLAFKVDRLPVPGETRVGEFTTGPGGKGSNQAIASSRSGADTMLITAFGDDHAGHSASKFLLENGVKCFKPFWSQTDPTGAASISIDKEGQNSIIVSLGANKCLKEDYLVKCMDHLTQNEESIPDVVVTQLEHGEYDTDISAPLEQLPHSCIKILNPAPMSEKRFDSHLLSNVDLITPNETEFLDIYKEVVERDLDVYPEDLHRLGGEILYDLCENLEVPHIIITLGENGCYIFNSEEEEYEFKPPLEVNVVSTAGAGDAFTGALAAYLASKCGNQRDPVDLNQSLSDAADFAIVAAGLSVTKEGTSPAMPTLEEIRASLSVYKS